jgi:PiT family inorganic phosphate transporter
VARNPALYAEPKGAEPPPWWIRGLLILTCTGVSFAHGSNDGQKGMGLIMLILIGVVPTAYALNRAMPDSHIQPFIAASGEVAQVLDRHSEGQPPTSESRDVTSQYLRDRKRSPAVLPALAQLIRDLQTQVAQYRSLRLVPAGAVANVRNDMYLASEALRHLGSDPTVSLSKPEAAMLESYRGELNAATRFIPTWVKVAVAIALGLGTMVGWRRIVVTVGEKIGKSHLTYAQGASAELVAATTIAAADLYGLPVSTTHVLSSGVAGTMAANRSGLQMATVRNLALAWILTLPAAIVLAGSLFWAFSHVF